MAMTKKQKIAAGAGAAGGAAGLAGLAAAARGKKGDQPKAPVAKALQPAKDRDQGFIDKARKFFSKQEGSGTSGAREWARQAWKKLSPAAEGKEVGLEETAVATGLRAITNRRR